MRYLKGVVSAFLLASSFCIQAQEVASVQVIQQTDALQLLYNLQDDYWNYTIANVPELATFAGCQGEHGKWTDFSVEAIEQRRHDSAVFCERLKEIDRSALAKDYQLQYDILKWLIDIGNEGAFFPYEYLAIDQLNGINLSIPMLLQIVADPTTKGYETLIQRMEGVPRLIDQQIALLAEGVKSGVVAPKIVMRTVPDQILAQISGTPEQSEFYRAFIDIDDDDLKNKALQVIIDKIYPAYQKFHDFIVRKYIPACRETTGYCDLPNGKAAYAFLVKMHTTTNLTPLEIHQIGLAEVDRIHTEMKQILRDVSFEGSIHEFADHLKQDPSSYFNTKEELLQGYRDLLSIIEGNLPQLFNTMPTLVCEVVPIPEYSEASSIAAYYYPGSVETGRPGRFFANTHNLKEHPKWMMESLALHEALPGHHFQISLAQLADIPIIQKHSWTTAFVEGWGLYSESLGKELGLYKTPSDCFGRLVNEMLRALRLVVDTGLHDQAWSRQQAIDFYKQYLPIDEHEIINEIDRYIVMPAQALSYKIGELSLLSLRTKMQEKEGASFDIRTFHDKLLQLGGCLPLNVLEAYFL